MNFLKSIDYYTKLTSLVNIYLIKNRYYFNEYLNLKKKKIIKEKLYKFYLDLIRFFIKLIILYNLLENCIIKFIHNDFFNLETSLNIFSQ